MDSWKPVGTAAWVVVTAALGVLVVLLLTSPTHYVRVLDDANLAFHEAGHPLIGLFNPRLEVYGGTIFQLLFPCMILFSCWLRHESVGFSVGLVWLFENFLNISRYMGDARAHILPLVGGGDHDWTTIFTRWGVLRHEALIAGIVSAVGWLGLIGTWAWLTWQWKQRKI